MFICSQRVSRSRQVHRSQRVSSLQDKASENAQRYNSAAQTHTDYSPPPHDFQQPSQYWPFSNAGSTPRTYQSDTGWLENQVVPGREQQSCRRVESSQHDEPRIVSPAESHSSRRLELPSIPTRVLPSWQQRTEELHFWHQQMPGQSHPASLDPSPARSRASLPRSIPRNHQN
jgi:hypothetical protein